MGRVIFLLLALVACTDDEFELDTPPDFPTVPVPADNALTEARVALGKRLFYDTQLSRTQEVSLRDFRKDIAIDVFNEAGQKVLSYLVFRCWVSEYQPLPDLDATPQTR